MGIARVLFKQKLIHLFYLLFISLLIIGCDSKMVNYKDFLIKPIAVRSDDYIKIKQGSTVASAAWIKPEIRIEQDEILVSGKLTLLEQPTILSIKLPDSSKKFRVFWVDDNSSKTEIAIGDKDRITTFHIYGTLIEHGSNKPINKAEILFQYATEKQMSEGTIGSSRRDGHFDITFEQWWGFGDPAYKAKPNESFKLIFRKEGYNDKIASYDLRILPKQGNVKIETGQIILVPK